MSTPVGQPFWHQLLHSPAGGPAGFDLGMLILRVGFGGFLALGHGLPKLLNYSAILEHGFPDPLGIGSANSLMGAIACELVFGLFIVVGAFTRLSAVPVIFNMCVAAFVVHAAAPLLTPQPPGPAKEPAILYLIPFVAILFAGAGRFSVDGCIQPPNPSSGEMRDEGGGMK
jgi:putative oxidoreductase